MESVNHIQDEPLERYSLGMSLEGETCTVEEHLLICQTCRDRLESLDSYHRAMRTASLAIRRHTNTAADCNRVVVKA